MKRRDFFTKLGLTAAAAVVAPTIAKSAQVEEPMDQEWEEVDVGSPSGVLLYDIESTPDMVAVSDVLRIWKEQGIFVYNSKTGSKPSVQNNINSVKIVDTSKYNPLKEQLINYKQP